MPRIPGCDSSDGCDCRHTSKKPEKGEEEGVHYYFVKKDAMQRMVEEGKFVETSEAGPNMFGTAAATLQQVGRPG